jgi:phosphatidylserine/phosphatidylglycerophosphate/cardiolipin synthase-like enzyme
MLKQLGLGVLLAFVAYAIPHYYSLTFHQNIRPHDVTAEIANLVSDAPLSLFAEPDTGVAPIIEAIHSAKSSIDLVMYDLEDTIIEQELANARTRNVVVRVLLDGSSHFGKKPNLPAYDFLKKHDVQVKWTANTFPITHQKTLVIDNATAYILTFNLVPKYYASGRDFGIVDTNPDDVSAIEHAFDADWQGVQLTAGDGHDLVWSPGSAPTLLALIDGAQKSLDIYNEEMADQRITDALIRASKRGVRVRVNITYATSWKAALISLVANGVQVRTYASSASLYIHAKMILADNARVFVGSENFSGQSLDANRELGILISRPDILTSLLNIFEKDWAGSRPMNANGKSVKASAKTAPKKSSNNTSTPIANGTIKMSSSKICHAPDDPWYTRTTAFSAFATLQECLNAGGHLPASTH